MGFQYRSEVKQFYDELKERLHKFNLELNEDKTRIIEFGRFAERDRRKRGEENLKHLIFWDSRIYAVKHGRIRSFKSNENRSRNESEENSSKSKKHYFDTGTNPVSSQGKCLQMVVQGYFNYFAVPGTAETLSAFRKEICKHWLRALRRRSHKAQNLTWKRMENLIETWIPKVKILHPYPNERLRV